jgi:hypothetical protein
MITKPTVFVLGAGSMTDYGFPIGWELVREVVQGFSKNAELRSLLLNNSGFQEQQLDKYLEALDGSAQNSVDAFLEEQHDHLEIGIATMSMVLVRRENTAKLYQDGNPQTNWLRYLLMHLRGTSFEEFHRNAVSFVTFNYDRSLEHFLCRTLAHTFSKSEPESGEVIKKIPIIHLHGRLGYLPWEGEKSGPCRPYETTITRDVVNTCIREVKVVHRTTEINAQEFAQAKALLAKADRVYFLGVGFNNRNLERIGVKQLQANKARATGVGLTQHEYDDVHRSIGDHLMILIGANCITLLREDAQLD